METTQILTPVGRLVAGSLWEPQTKNAEGGPLVYKTGPNVGQPRVDYYFAIAIEKTNAGYAELWAQIHAVGKASFPNLFDASGNANIAWKITDGDSTAPNTKGKRPCDKPGFPGCWVLHFSSSYAPVVCGNDTSQVLTDPASVKRGYYIRVSGTVRGNGSQQQPGIYLNHNIVQMVAYGEEIQTGPNAQEAFGSSPVGALPAGASTTPPNPATAPATDTPPAPGGAPMAPPAAAAPTLPAPVAPGPGLQPATSFMAPPAPAAPAAAPAPPVRYAYAGKTYTAEQLKASGWDDTAISKLPPAPGDNIPF